MPSLRRWVGRTRSLLSQPSLQQRGRGEQVKFSFRSTVGPLVSGEYDLHALLSGLVQQLIGHCWEVMQQDGVAPNHSDPVLEFCSSGSVSPRKSSSGVPLLTLPASCY